MTNSLNVKLLDASIQLLASNFKSGNDHLDRFLKSPSALDENYGKTYVLISDNEDTILGFYNIGMGYIEIVDGGMHWKMGGAVHINGFALDMKYHGLVQEETPDGIKINLSDFFLYDCINRIMQIREEYIGCTFITLCATDEGYSLYKRSGFEDLEDDMNFSVEAEEVKCKPMYYAIDVV